VADPVNLKPQARQPSLTKREGYMQSPAWHEMNLFLRDHKELFRWLSFAACASFSYGMLTFSNLKVRWVKFLGIGAAILALEYLWILFGGSNPLEVRASRAAGFLLVGIPSTINNLCFIAAANDLEHKRIVPRWCWWLAGWALLGCVIDAEPGPWRFVLDGDDVFSAVSLCTLGMAMYRNISFRRAPLIAIEALLSSTMYGALYLVEWVAGLFQVLPDQVWLKPWLAFASLVMKVSVFGLAYVLFRRLAEIYFDLPVTQKLGVDGVQEYISSKGVVRLIGERLAADVHLVVLLPGQIDRRVAVISWSSDGREESPKVLRWDRVNEDTRQCLSQSKGLELSSKTGPEFIVVEPIKARGIAIGCLKAVRNRHPFSRMAIGHLRVLAELTAPSVQSYRQLAALDLLSARFAESESGQNTYSPQDAGNAVAERLHDVFSPVATRLSFDFGFESIEPVTLWNGVASSLAENDRKPEDFDGLKVYLEVLTARRKNVRMGPDRPQIGEMALAINRAGDPPGCPALGTDHLHRRAAATLCSNAYIELVHDYFKGLLKDLSAVLSGGELSLEQWFYIISTAAKKAGLAWALAAKDTGKLLGGDPLLFARVIGLQRDPCTLVKNHEGDAFSISLWSLSSPVACANHIVRVSIPGPGAAIYFFGVERPAFNNELAFGSPWRNFLAGLGRTARDALSRIEYADQLRHKQIQGTLLRQTSRFCRWVGREQLAILEEAIGKNDPGDAWLCFEEFKTLSRDLRLTGEFLSTLTSDPKSRNDVTHEAAATISEAWWEVTQQFDSEGIIFEGPAGDFSIPIAKADLFLSALRILQWMVLRKGKAAAENPKIAVDYTTDGDSASLVFRDESRRLSKPLRDLLFESFTQRSSGKLQMRELENREVEERAGLFLPLYFARTLAEVRYGGSLNDQTDELKAPAGHQFVLSFPLKTTAVPDDQEPERRRSRAAG
jgi:hypothetical protein